MKKMVLLILMTFCVSALAHEHHDAPHGGSLIELGDEFANVEFVLDATSGKLSAYIFDGEVENSLRLAQKSLSLKIKVGGQALDLQLKAVANPLTGEKLGDSSEFSAISKGLKGVKSFSGTLEKITVHDETFSKITCQFPGIN